MARYSAGLIPASPTVVSGVTAFGTHLNPFLTAVLSGFAGTTRSDDVAAGHVWSKEVAGGYELNMFVGSATDVPLGTVTTATGQYALPIDAIVDALKTGWGVPIGASLFWNSSILPTGYVWEDGATYSQTTYPDAFAVMGTTFNIGGEPAGTFRVEDSRGEFIRIWDNGRGVDVGRALGSAQTDELKSHQHIGGFAGQNANAAYGTADTGITANLNAQSGTSVGNYPRTSLTGGTETRPRNVSKGMIVRLY